MAKKTAGKRTGLKVKRLAEVSWCADDIRALRPNWDDAKCNAFLDANEDDIQCAMIERGWDAIRDLLRWAERK